MGPPEPGGDRASVLLVRSGSASPFPFARYRAGQREVIDAARAAFDEGRKVVVVEAPTGAGKSAIAVTLARQATSAYLLTAQKVLQDQYQRDFDDLGVTVHAGDERRAQIARALEIRFRQPRGGVDYVAGQHSALPEHSVTFSQHGELVSQSAEYVRVNNRTEGLRSKRQGHTIRGNDLGSQREVSSCERLPRML